MPEWEDRKLKIPYNLDAKNFNLCSELYGDVLYQSIEKYKCNTYSKYIKNNALTIILDIFLKEKSSSIKWYNTREVQ